MLQNALTPVVAALALALAPASAAAAGEPEEPVPLIVAPPTPPLAPDATGTLEVVPTPTPEPTPAPDRSRSEPRRPLPPAATLDGAIRRAFLAGKIAPSRYEEHRATALRAQQVLVAAAGPARQELATVLATAQRLAADRRLTASRLDQVLLTVQRNTELVSAGALPAPGTRRTFGRDPLVFQRYSGHGVQVQPLATAGRANHLSRACIRRRGWLEDVAARHAVAAIDRRAVPAPVPRQRGENCRERELRRVLDRLAAIAARRDGGVAWEHLFEFGGSPAPWISGMTQATAAQAFARGGIALADQGYLDLAEAALKAFELPAPTGVRVAAPGGVRYTLYSGRAGLEVLNGSLQAVIGLHEVERRTGSRRAGRLWRQAEPAARAAVAAHDTGAWSLYSRGGAESTLHYHRLVRGFLAGLCKRVDARAYCEGERRFARYEREPPRVRVAVAGSPRAEARTRVRVRLNKGSRVTVRANGRVLHRERLSRGVHRLEWRPARKATVRLAVAARGPEGRRGTASTTVQVRESARVLAERRRARAERKRLERARAERREARRERREARRQRREARQERREARRDKREARAPERKPGS